MNPYLRTSAREGPTVVAHRGASGLAPENTLESFELAFELGAPMVELDVHLTKDGKLVVIHDDTLERTTGRKGFVSQARLDEIQALDAGKWFVDALEKRPLPPPWGPTPEERRRFLDAGTLARYASGKVRPPALEEVLALARKHDRFVNVELKAMPRFYEGLARATVELVRTLRLVEQVAFSSFDHRTLAETKRLEPAIATGVLTLERLHEPGKYVKQVVGADAWVAGCVGEVDVFGFHSIAFETKGAAGLDRTGIASAHDHGVTTFVWTENDPARQAALRELRVDGIITDFPNRLLES